MPNKPRPENRHRMVRVEDDLWEAARIAAAATGTTRAAVMRDALHAFVSRVAAELDQQGGDWQTAARLWNLIEGKDDE